MQCNLRTALLGTEPESAKQSQENIQQQESHSHNVITQIIAPRLLVVTPYIFKRTYFGDKDVTDTELLLTVFLQAPDEIMILIGPDTKAQLQSRIIPTELIKKGVRITGLLEITVTYIFQSCPQPESLRSITEKLKLLAHQLCHRTVVLPVKIVGSKELPPFQHLGKLFGRFTTCALIAEYTYKIGSHHTADSPIIGHQCIITHLIRRITAVIRI